ncbi:DUF5460 family protein [Rickettsia helvetica]|uniref:Peptidase-M10 domain-containing protein n=1 Tax=Rickettsia helvetica TaxID=35789 RepID=A0ABM9NAE3_RICHE|nr:DUF5460 family protein [Rickettsia helvetica]MCZ6884416.1 DUF5460 family protein [Rickettsia endosymbiont of Ixodes ricinus]MCZ6896641.1 DUF5460 family protein [Rickettsia endosymbiont of Ixodes ricinus]
MAPVLNSNVFKCVMPIFSNEMISSLPGNVNHIVHKLGNTILSSVYNTVEGTFKKGFLVNNAHCNWKNIEYSFQDSPDDFSILHTECIKGLDTPINNIFTDAENNPRILLQQAVTPNQNGTVNIFDQLYKVTHDYMFSQGNITETNGADFLGLNECTKEEAINTLQNYNTYKDTLIPHESFINTLENTLNRLGISLDNVSPTEIGKHILDQLGKAYTEATTPSTTGNPNNDTNDGGYSGAYIAAVAVGTLVVGAILGYTVKYGWDWYKGRNIKNENLELKYENSKLKLGDKTLEILIEDQAILDEIIGIGNLTDILAILSNPNQDTINLHGQDYDISLLKSKTQDLDKAIIKLNSISNIFANINSLGNTLHIICTLLNGQDTFMTVKSFATLIKESRKTDTKSEEHKNCLEKIFETLLGIDETSNREYHYILEEELQNHEMPLLADGSSPSGSSSIEHC